MIKEDGAVFCDGQHSHDAAALAEEHLPPETELAELAELFKVFWD